MHAPCGGASQGFFDRSSAGFRSTPVSVAVERHQVAFFSRIIGERFPIHWDLAAARAAGFPDLVAPPTFASVLDAAADQQRVRSNEKSILEIINCDRRYLHAQERYDYHGLIFAGEAVIVECEVKGFEDKRNGALEFAHIHSTVRHEQRGLLVSMTRSLVHRLR